MTAVILPFPRPDTAHHDSAKAEERKCWAAYQRAVEELGECPCDLHHERRERAFRAWQRAFLGGGA